MPGMVLLFLLGKIVIKATLKRSLKLISFILPAILIFSTCVRAAQAQSPDGRWSNFVNISNTPYASTYPCITADIAGNVHVLWSEDYGGKTKNYIYFNPDGTPVKDSRGNPINTLTDAGNTLYYTRWDGKGWSDPIDVQINTSGIINYPEASVDSQGVLHVAWVATQGENSQLLYSHVYADRANSASAWSQPMVLAEPIISAYYPLDIAIDSSDGIHIVYSKFGIKPGAYVTSSYDGGNTWAAPIQLYSTSDEAGTQEGISPIKLVIDKQDRLHAAWTRFDSSGNGKALYYAQSLDQGRTWSEPFTVAAWQQGWYEVDWLNVGVIGDEIHLVWEGSSQVAAQAERISHDGGVTWDQTHFILTNIVGENGFANLLTDSAEHLQLLIVKRGDAATLTNGIWYTHWDQSRWQDPVLLGTKNKDLYSIANQLDSQLLQDLLRNTFTGNGLRYQKAAIVNGNELHVVVVDEWDGDIWESHTTLDAPYIPPQPYPPQTASHTTITPTPISQNTQESPLTQPPEYALSTEQTTSKLTNPLRSVLLGIVPTIIILIGFIVSWRILKRH